MVGCVWHRGEQTPFGLVRIALVVVPFLYVGTLISKNFAALLEEHDIFVPEDDDDDDWGLCRLPGYQVSPKRQIIEYTHLLSLCICAVHGEAEMGTLINKDRFNCFDKMMSAAANLSRSWDTFVISWSLRWHISIRIFPFFHRSFCRYHWDESMSFWAHKRPSWFSLSCVLLCSSVYSGFLLLWKWLGCPRLVELYRTVFACTT